MGEKEIVFRLSLVFISISFFVGTSGFSQVNKFVPAKGEVLEIWQITNDPIARDWANYHNTQSWSPDGRYLLYNHFGSDGKELGKKNFIEVHVYDLYLNKDINLGYGMEPKWANKHNWVFFMRNIVNADGKSTWDIFWHDFETAKTIKVISDINILKDVDYKDEYIYALAGEKNLNAARIKIQESSSFEFFPPDGEFKYDWFSVNPQKPAIITRDHQYEDFNFSSEGKDIPFTGRRFCERNLDGTYRSELFPMMDGSHFSWLGNGEYFLCGNGIMRGIKWDKFTPGNLEILSPMRSGDICRAGLSGRWMVGSYYSGRGPLTIADLRSGDGWIVFDPNSIICYPNDRDNSGPYDIDAKGSPDATKVSFVTNYDIANGPHTFTESEKIEKSLMVESTNGFPSKGRLVISSGFGGEVIQYESITPTSFENLTRGLYGTLTSNHGKGFSVTSFESRLVPEELQRNMPLADEKSRIMIEDPASPLLKQRLTDVYTAIVRYPDRPYLRNINNKYELIPGENHWETKGYDIYKNDVKINKTILLAGIEFQINASGEYSVVSVEWSGLQSKQSNKLNLTKDSKIVILCQKPDDFSWTYDKWLEDSVEITSDKAEFVEISTREIIHLYDGVISREWYRWGQISQKFDYNMTGKAIRRQFYIGGVLSRKELHNRDGQHISTEFFNNKGDLIESIQNLSGSDHSSYGYLHWWYMDGVPVKAVKSGKMYIRSGDTWVEKCNSLNFNEN